MGDRTYIAIDRLLLNGIHIRRLGMSIYLLAFFIDKQTDADGTVYYGKPITYRWIRDELPNAPPERTLRVWLSTLKSQGYIVASTIAGGGMRVRVVASKKWPTSQLGLFDRLSKSCDSAEEKLSICGNQPRQDPAGGSGNILPTILYIEKDENSEKRKSAADVAVDIVNREYPGFKARPIGGPRPHLVLEQKKKIS